MLAISEISIDFREDFLKDKLLLQDFKTGETLLEVLKKC